jgi:integration host factor subunit beta
MPSQNSSQLRAKTAVVSMTRAELIEQLAQTRKMAWQHAELVVQAIFGCMEESLRQGERIEVRGFGTFEVRSYKGYKGRNPKTGDPIEVAPKRLPFFKASKSLAARMNIGRDNKPAIVPDQGSET